MGHVNIRDIMSKTKKDDLKAIILFHQFDIFAVTETWLEEEIEDGEIDIPGYILLRNDRPPPKKGGGVLMYIRDCWDVCRENFKFKPPVESLMVTIRRRGINPIKIFTIYRPPETKPTFIAELEELLIKTKEEFYILTDMNINQLTSVSQSKQLHSTLLKTGYKQMIQTPTRITPTSETLIDLIITNKPSHSIKSGVWSTCLADHELIYLIRKKPKMMKDPPKIMTRRSFKNTDPEKLATMITTAPWWILDFCTTTDKKYAMFIYLINFILDIHAPYKSMRMATRKPEWMTDEYFKLTKQCIFMKEKAHKSKSDSDWLQYKVLRSHIDKIKKKLKKSSFSQSIDDVNSHH